MEFVDTFPTNELNGLQYRVGRMLPFGATLTENGGVNFSIFSKEASSCTLVLFHTGEQEPFAEIPFPEEFRIGNVYAMMVFGISVEKTEYAYRFDGVYDPDAGLLFDRRQILLDPYAKSVSGRSAGGQSLPAEAPSLNKGQSQRPEAPSLNKGQILPQETPSLNKGQRQSPKTPSLNKGQVLPQETPSLNKGQVLPQEAPSLNKGQCQSPETPFLYRGHIIREDYDWEGDKPLEVPMEDLVIYEMHVRGFTQDPSSGVKYRGTFAGIVEKIPYLKSLGINCVELMPVFAFDEREHAREMDGRTLFNYWGYSTVCFFAPKAGYAASGPLGMEVDELKNLIKKLHQNGIAVILDVVFNHTAEGNENGTVISYKGIDNRTYYLLTPEGKYANFSGCGNTMNCNNAVVRNHILDCLRYWVSSYHIDGFRFDLASILTRDKEGNPMMSPPLVETLANDAVLGSTLLIAEAWDAAGLYQVGNFPSWNRWSEWNGKYRDCVRRFIKGDETCAPELYCRIAGSGDLYTGRGPAASINFITCHDGFTMYDLVSYNEKHNEANGEENRDGTDCNDSWNCGAEGETDDPGILALRRRQILNFYTLLLISRGVPMLLSGDEFANTQFGNNNAYCHDNEISWLDWGRLNDYQDLFAYVKTLLALRAAHPVLRAPRFDTDVNGTGYPELSFHSLTPREFDTQAPALFFAVLYAEDHVKYGTEKDAFLYILVNAHWEEHTFELPALPQGLQWHLVCCSRGSCFPAGEEQPLIVPTRFTLGPRESAVLIGA